MGKPFSRSYIKAAIRFFDKRYEESCEDAGIDCDADDYNPPSWHKDGDLDTLAAAPQMLEALERIGECLSPCVAAFDGEDMADVATEVSCALGIARAALTAARPDSPTPNTEEAL